MKNFFSILILSLTLLSCVHKNSRNVASVDPSPDELLAAARLATAALDFQDEIGLGDHQSVPLTTKDFSLDPQYELWLFRSTSDQSVTIVVVKKEAVADGRHWAFELIEKSQPIPADLLRLEQSSYLEVRQRPRAEGVDEKYKLYFDLIYDEVGRGASLVIEYQIAVIEEDGKTKASLAGLSHSNMQPPREGYVSHEISCNTISGDKTHVATTNLVCADPEADQALECTTDVVTNGPTRLRELRLLNKKISQISVAEFRAVRSGCVAD